MDVKQIKLCMDGVTRTFAEWTDDFVNKYYPDLGRRCYRVPAFHFNQQQLVSRKTFDGLELQSPDTGHARGDLAHTLVLESMEQLSGLLEKEGPPLFIISALDYDNYLARVKAPPCRKGKENRPKAKKASKDTVQENDGVNSPNKETEIEHKEKIQENNTKCDLGKNMKQDSSNNDKVFRLNNQHEDKLLTQGNDNDYTQKETPSTVNADSVQREQMMSKSKTMLAAAANCDIEKLEDSQACAEKALTNSSEQEQHEESLNEGAQPSKEKSKAKKQRKKKKASANDVTKVGSSVLENMDVDCNEIATGTQPSPKKPTMREGLPPRPRDITEQGQRGDIDVMLLHPHCGVILMEVKATGHPGWCHTDHEIRDRVKKAINQVKRGRDVFHFIMPDLNCVPCVTLVVALPYLTKEKLDQVLSPLPSDPEILFLCNDDIASLGAVPSESSMISADDGDQTQDSAADPPTVLSWWDNNIVPALGGSSLALEDMKTIVGRTCGLLSVVSVWTRTKPRVEIRTPGEAISQVADRFSSIVLLPNQASLLAQPSPAYLCLTGPMGSGKTLMLQLKGCQWVKEGKRVVVLNVRSTGKGRPIGHVLEEAIKRVQTLDETSGSVERVDLATMEFSIQAFHAKLEGCGPTDKLCFVMDELTHHTIFLLEQLISQYPSCCIWCVAMFVRELPNGFEHFRLGAVLRSPPSVQLLLKELDLNPVHSDVYSTRSAARGLPCDGPPIIFIEHKKHGTNSRHHDCPHCADQFVNVLQDMLGLVFPDQQEAVPALPGNPQKPGKPRAQPKAVQAKPLSFRDIICLVCVPLGYYKQQSTGLWLSPVNDILKFCKYAQSCPFITRLKEHKVPVKIVIDNTSREIAVPSNDEIIITDVMGVQSLERKVVFYLPGGPVLESAPIKPGISDSNQGSSGSLEKSVTSSTDLTFQSGPSGKDIETMKLETGKTNPTSSSPNDFVLHATDTVSSLSSNNELPYIEKSPEVSQVLLGNMMVVKALSAAESKSTEETQDEDNSATGTAKPRMGMDLRGDSPWLMSALDEAAERKPLDLLSEQEKYWKSSEPVDFFTAQSSFLVPDFKEKEGCKQSEVQRIRDAMAQLSMDDQDWLFMGAARCLSQLIVVIP